MAKTREKGLRAVVMSEMVMIETLKPQGSFAFARRFDNEFGKMAKTREKRHCMV